MEPGSNDKYLKAISDVLLLSAVIVLCKQGDKGEINKAGDDQPSDQVKLETVVEASKLEKKLGLMKAAAATGDDKKYQTKSSCSSSNIEVEVIEDGPEIYKLFMAKVRSYIYANPLKGKARYHHRYGFYNIPKDMLSPDASTRAEEIKLLYQPATSADFRNISNLLKDMIEGSNIERQSAELRHYYYHLNSFASRESKRFENCKAEAFSKGGEEIAKSWYRPEDIDDDDHEKEPSSSNNINGHFFRVFLIPSPAIKWQLNLHVAAGALLVLLCFGLEQNEE
ncbi:hypothetical protein H6P81_016942 [Aristolochia fimbriata]|uniref:Uncharacterized protein n=1 Tax=Aristolochia fimbriata TaxID=158543 RepID=A0AAV7DXU4_ARIFI|nr:hypothetical protein H6P81_016942 [Aristolochia fimbriata]